MFGKNKNAIYDKLHRYGFYSILAVSGVTAVLFVYNCYLFKKGLILNRLIHLNLFY